MAEANQKKYYLENEHHNQITLQRYYLKVLGDPGNAKDIPDDLETILAIRKIEDGWIAYEDDRIKGEKIPQTLEEFLPWYQGICTTIDSDMSDFYDFLAEQAPLEGLAYYFALEEQVDGRFDDTIALSQIGTSGPGKLALARNFWDEMGKGKPERVHATLFGDCLQYMRQALDRKGIVVEEQIDTEGLKNGNMFLMWSLRRRFALRMIGGLGVLEDTAGKRFNKVVQACKRLKVPRAALAYAVEHTIVDPIHGEEWMRDLIIPLMQANPGVIDEIAKGILIRRTIGKDYFDTTFIKIKNFLNNASFAA